MRWVKVADEDIETNPHLMELMWPDAYRSFSGSFYGVPETHPNFAVILLSVPNPRIWEWHAEPTGTVQTFV
jgi:hypothetical protein